MLRTNLSTRPFYNDQAVHVVLAIGAVLVLAFTIFNVMQLVTLTRRQAALSSQTAAAEAKARELRAHAERTRQGIDAKQLDAISVAAREANDIIGQRLFSWTELLNRLEATLPADVRITSVRPRVERDNRITVQMTVHGQSIDDVEEFMANLDGTPAFSDVIPLEDSPVETGGVQVSLEGKYVPAP